MNTIQLMSAEGERLRVEAEKCHQALALLKGVKTTCDPLNAAKEAIREGIKQLATRLGEVQIEEFMRKGPK